MTMDKAVTIGANANYDIKDEDNMSSDDDRSLATQQSIKSYVDSEVAPKVEYITGEIVDVSTSASSWVISPIAGTITKIYTVLEGAITVGDADISFEIGGVAVTDGGITIAYDGSAAGDIDASTPTATNIVAAGQAIEIITDGGSTTAAKATVLIEITPSATVTAGWKKYIRGEIADISTAASSWTIAPCAGSITKIWSVISGAVTVADATLTFELGGVAITDGAITVSYDGSAAGTVDSSTPSALNTVAAGDAIELITDGGSTDAASAVIMLEITP